MAKLRRISLGLMLALAVAAGCSKEHDPAKLKGHNVLLITLDTTRADRIGCYGYAQAETPTLDKLASQGTLFEQAFAQVNLTLPSHASIMTGRYPREHGVRDNARNALSREFPTLASRFQQEGYRTAAFVAAFVIDSRFGLDHGFDLYNDDMGVQKEEKQPLEWQQPADVITNRSLEWLKQSSQKPFFCWVHYYDPHDPYLPPEAFRKEGRPLYDGEIAFVDTQIRRLVDWLEAAQLLDTTLVVVVGDHGESFDEHGERGHTNFVYETNLHVPMSFTHSAALPAGQRIRSVVETVDVFPTMFELFGWDPPDGLLARSLAPALLGDSLDLTGAYSESMYVLNSFGWAEQRSLTTDRWKYISTTKPELYDRKADPGELSNLVHKEPRVAADMLEQLKSRYELMTPGKAGLVEYSSEAREALASLGYIGAESEATQDEVFLSEGRRDPKDMKKILTLFHMARGLMAQAQDKEDFSIILPLLNDIVKASPDSPIFHYLRGVIALKAGDPEGALYALDLGLQIAPDHVPAHLTKAQTLMLLGRVDEALAEYEVVLKIDPNHSETHVQYGEILRQMGRTEEAIGHFRQAAALSPTMTVAHAKYVALLEGRPELAGAVEGFAAAVRANPDHPERHNELGVAFARLGRMNEAIAAFEEAVRRKPDFGEAILNLGKALLDVGQSQRAKGLFERAKLISGFEGKARYYQGVAISREGRIDETVQLFEEAIALDPKYIQPIGELSTYYIQQRRPSDAIRILRVGVDANPNAAPLLSTLGQLLATCPRDDLRDGAAALRYLEHANQLRGGQDPVVLANLAAAHAELGEFERAVETANQALLLFEDRGGQKDAIEKLKGQIQMYKLGNPFRDKDLSDLPIESGR